MNLGYSLAVEKLCGMKMPEKAQVIRVIIAELNRIASHLVGMGAYGLDLGTFSPFLYAFREREMILDLFEEVCGARLTYSYITIGGVHDDLPDGWVARCQKFLDYLKPRIEEYHTLLTRNHIFVQRTANLGILSKELALSYGCTGPMLRGSLDREQGRSRLGPAQDRAVLRLRDVRFQGHHAALPAKPAEAVIGDCWHRFYVRMLEVIESIKIVEQGLSVTRRPRARIASSRRATCRPAKPTSRPNARAARWASTSWAAPPRTPVPLRVRARSSSFSNLSVTNEICRGCLIADVPAIVGSIDIVMGEIDR